MIIQDVANATNRPPRPPLDCWLAPSLFFLQWVILNQWLCFEEEEAPMV